VHFSILDLDLDLAFLKRTWTRTWTCPLKVDLDLAFLKRTWTRTWTCPLKVDLDLDLRTVNLDLHLDLAVAGLVTSLTYTTGNLRQENISLAHLSKFAKLHYPVKT